MKKQLEFINELFRIVSGALRLDIDKVRNYTAFLAEKLETAGETASAGRLRKLLAESDHQLRPSEHSFAKVLPVDAESRFPLVERVNLKALRDTPLVLSQAQWDVVNEFLSVAKSHALFDAQGVGTSLSLLMYGPPGTGKTRLAHFIAQELGIDLYLTRLDGLISSFLGTTAKNIRALFDFAGKTPCVLFLDEFDAIAKLRRDSQELGELKRVVNSFIQNLDSVGSQSIVIAATNHEELLDSAIWRRFSYRLEFSYPSADSRKQLWTEFMRPIEFKARELDVLVDLSEGFTGSDIQEVCLRLRRQHITTKQVPQLHNAFQVLQNMALGEGEERRFLAKLKTMDHHAMASALRARDDRLYCHSALAQLFGISKATAHRWVKSGVKDNA